MSEDAVFRFRIEDAAPPRLVHSHRCRNWVSASLVVPIVVNGECVDGVIVNVYARIEDGKLAESTTVRPTCFEELAKQSPDSPARIAIPGCVCRETLMGCECGALARMEAEQGEKGEAATAEP